MINEYFDETAISEEDARAASARFMVKRVNGGVEVQEHPHPEEAECSLLTYGQVLAVVDSAFASKAIMLLRSVQ